MSASRVPECHWLLLRIAGTATDDLIHRCRSWLAEGRALDVGRAVAYAVLSRRLRLIDADVDLLAELLAADGMDNSALSLVAVDDLDPMPLYGFAASMAGVDAATRVPAADRRPDEPTAAAEPTDDIELRALLAVADVGVVRATWRAWRYPGDGAPWPRPRRVWLVETDAGADLPAVTGRIQSTLDDAGEIEGQVETYPVGSELPSYQLLVRSYGALMWTREPGRAPVVATLTVRVGGGETVSRWEAERILRYLVGCVTVLVTADRTDDLLNATERDAVPMGLLTDGAFVWCEAMAYYLGRYRLAPDPVLLAHIRALDYAVPLIDGAAVYRAAALVRDAAVVARLWGLTG